MAETPRKKTLQEPRSEAIAELERRGYDVRGKTPAQIQKNASATNHEAEIRPAKVAGGSGFYFTQYGSG